MVPQLHGKNEARVEPAQAQMSVAILMPFEPKIMPKAKIEASLKTAVKEVETELFRLYPSAFVKQAVHRLKTLIANLDYSTHKKSIAIFLSPFLEKVYYWNMPVQEKVVVGSSLALRELVRNKPEEKNYLLLVLNKHHSCIYLGNGEKIIRLVSDSPRLLYGKHMAHLPFADQQAQEKSLLCQFMQHFDNSMSIILKAYPLPVLVMASEELLTCFAENTKNGRHISKAIRFSLENPTEEEVLAAAKPQLEKWDGIKQKFLLSELEHALNEGKLAVGMDEVWTAAKDRKGKLLVVEEDYVFPAYLDHHNTLIFADAIPINESLHVNDAVNDALEKVLADGGTVELVKKGVLKDFLHIALILH